MAGVIPPKTVGVPTSTTQHLQGLLVRRTATAEPKSLAQYFNHVADAVRVNDELTALRKTNLKRRWQVAAHGYESVLNRKKRSVVHVGRPSVTGPAYLTRATPVAAATPTPSTTAATAIPSTAAAVATPAATAASNTSTASTAMDKSHPTPAAIAAAAAAAAAVSARAAAAAKAAARPVAPVAVAPAKPTLLVQPTAPKPAPVAIPSTTNVRPAPATMAAASVAIASSAATPNLLAASMAASKPAPLHVPPQVLAASQPIPMPANLAQSTQPMQPQPLQPQPLQPQPVAPASALPRRADLVVGSRVMIRHTADLVACGARNLVGKTGRVVAVPQVYGQEVYSVYIDEHETMFQVPFNALVLISPPAPTPMPINMQHQPPRSMHQLTPGGMISQPQPSVAPTSMVANVMQPTAAVPTTTHGIRPTPSIEDIKLEHSYQLHRLMQQQYREIQVLQQQYAECRLVNPAALPSIQKELSKLRLVHLSQVQTLKSKQALDLLGK